ncbi:MAG: GntR family transcriptional regulator [Bifidobacteriaceae bacterium]|nr:GntR family transcriptional regulator [Bifidobacteriaceae bacterium]
MTEVDPGATTGAVGPAATKALAALASALNHGTYQPGSRLPGERDLSVQLGVSRTTVRKALEELARSGLVARSPQRGWFVRQPLLGEPPSVLESFSEMARSRGMSPSSRVLSTATRRASFEEAAKLHIAASDSLYVVRRLRYLDDIPTCVDNTALVLARVPGIEQVDLTDRSLYEALQTVCGVAVARSSYSVQAQGAGPEVAELLQVDQGSPVLVGDEVTYDREGVPILVGRLTYRGDAYRFEADLFRPLHPDQ